MIRVGWLVDRVPDVGGAELTQAEFRAAAPDGIEIVDCPAGAVDFSCDLWVIHNCVTYTLADVEPLTGKPVVKYNHDVGPHVQPDVKAWLRGNATHVFCSPAQRDHMGLDGELVPPPVDLDRFRAAASRVNGTRSGICSVGSWGNAGKAPHRAAEWAVGRGGVDFYGSGAYAPEGAANVAYDAMPHLLAGYETFVFLPVVLEPFGRVVAEAWAAGCEVITNGLVGAKWFIENEPEAIESAAVDFWRLVV